MWEDEEEVVKLLESVDRILRNFELAVRKGELWYNL